MEYLDAYVNLVDSCQPKWMWHGQHPLDKIMVALSVHAYQFISHTCPAFYKWDEGRGNYLHLQLNVCHVLVITIQNLGWDDFAIKSIFQCWFRVHVQALGELNNDYT